MRAQSFQLLAQTLAQRLKQLLRRHPRRAWVAGLLMLSAVQLLAFSLLLNGAVKQGQQLRGFQRLGQWPPKPESAQTELTLAQQLRHLQAAPARAENRQPPRSAGAR